MYNELTANNLLHEFKKLRNILVREKENNWLRGVDVIIEKLNWSLSEKCEDPSCFFYSSCDTWKTMNKGNGSFSDYYIWRDDFDERVRLNSLYENIKDKIWDIVNNN